MKYIDLILLGLATLGIGPLVVVWIDKRAQELAKDRHEKQRLVPDHDR